MQFKCFSDWNQLPDSADKLFASASVNSMYFSRAWFETITVSALENDKTLLLACVVEDERVLAILPMKRGSNKDWYSLGHLYTWLYTILLAESGDDMVIKCLARGIDQSHCSSLRLEPVAENDLNIRMLQSELEAVGFYCNRQYRFYNWFHRVTEKNIDEYMAGRPSRVKNTITRKQRKLAREHEYTFQIYTGGNLKKALSDYNAVYNSSWKAREQFGGLIEALVDSFSREGWLRLGVLYIDGTPAAAQIWLVVHRKANIFKLSYDEHWKQYSPGSILIRKMMEYVIEKDGVKEIDFLMGNDAYKQDWMTERRERWGLYCGKTHTPGKSGKSIPGLLKGIFRRFQ